MLPTVIYLIEALRRALKKSGRGAVHARRRVRRGDGGLAQRAAEVSVRGVASRGFARPRNWNAAGNAVTLHPHNKG